MKIIAITPVYNEEGYIAKSITNSREHGLYPIVINNGSSDKTLDICGEMGVPILTHKTEKYDVYELMKWSVARVYEMGCDWFIIKDADEIFETYSRRPLATVIGEADKSGYNCLTCDDFEFWPTVDDDKSVGDYTQRILHYTYLNDPLQRAVKNSPEITTASPHRARGLVKEYPIHIILRHYKFLGLEHGKKKVKERLGRFITTKGSNTHYNKFTHEDKYYVLPHDVAQTLHVYDGTWVKKTVFNGWR